MKMTEEIERKMLSINMRENKKSTIREQRSSLTQLQGVLARIRNSMDCLPTLLPNRLEAEDQKPLSACSLERSPDSSQNHVLVIVATRLPTLLPNRPKADDQELMRICCLEHFPAPSENHEMLIVATPVSTSRNLMFVTLGDVTGVGASVIQVGTTQPSFSLADLS